MDLSWALNSEGKWEFGFSEPRSHHHLYCSDNGNHAGSRAEDRINRYYADLPEDLKAVIRGLTGGGNA